jgi:hypothetical protein
MLGNPAERNSAGSVCARRTTGLRRAGSCQDASFRGPVVQRPFRARADGPWSRKAEIGQSGQGSCRKAAQTSSVAERLTAVQPSPQVTAERAPGRPKCALGRSKRGESCHC